MMLTMVVRFMLWKHHGRSDLLGSFKPIITQIQNKHFQQLYRILGHGSDVDVDAMGEIVHRILYHTFTMPTDILVQVASIVDQSIILSMLTERHNFWHDFRVLTRH